MNVIACVFCGFIFSFHFCACIMRRFMHYRYFVACLVLDVISVYVVECESEDIAFYGDIHSSESNTFSMSNRIIWVYRFLLSSRVTKSATFCSY